MDPPSSGGPLVGASAAARKEAPKPSAVRRRGRRLSKAVPISWTAAARRRARAREAGERSTSTTSREDDEQPSGKHYVDLGDRLWFMRERHLVDWIGSGYLRAHRPHAAAQDSSLRAFLSQQLQWHMYQSLSSYRMLRDLLRPEEDPPASSRGSSAAAGAAADRGLLLALCADAVHSVRAALDCAGQHDDLRLLPAPTVLVDELGRTERDIAAALRGELPSAAAGGGE